MSTCFLIFFKKIFECIYIYYYSDVIKIVIKTRPEQFRAFSFVPEQLSSRTEEQQSRTAAADQTEEPERKNGARLPCLISDRISRKNKSTAAEQKNSRAQQRRKLRRKNQSGRTAPGFRAQILSRRKKNSALYKITRAERRSPRRFLAQWGGLLVLLAA